MTKKKVEELSPEVIEEEVTFEEIIEKPKVKNCADVILVAKNYVVVLSGGNGQHIECLDADKKYKIGDKFEIL